MIYYKLIEILPNMNSPKRMANNTNNIAYLINTIILGTE